MGVEYNGLSKKALASLAEHDILTVGDLKGWDKSALVALPGLGDVTAERLVELYEHSTEDYVGTEWPWVLDVRIHIPKDQTANVIDYGEDALREVFAGHRLVEAVFADIDGALRDQRRLKLVAERNALLDKAQELEAEIDTL